MRKTITVLLLFFTCCFVTQAQKWIEAGTGSNTLNANNTIQSILIDKVGNVYAAGSFTDSTNQSKGHTYVATWNETDWTKLGGKNADTLNGQINSIVMDDSGNVYAAGNFTDTNGYYYVAKWTDTCWTELGADSLHRLNANGYIYSIIADDSCHVYAAGNFTNSNGFYYVAKWTDSTWIELGTDSAHALRANGWIYPIVLDDSGNVYAAGNFTDTSGNYYYIAKWNGTSWTELGTGNNALNANGFIRAMTVDTFNNIYAAGEFTDAAGNHYVAKWNGTTWTELGSDNGALGANNNINTLTTDNKGNLYAGGNFTDVNGNPYIAKWNGKSWSELGTEKTALNANRSILSIVVDTWGNLYAAGNFSDTSGYDYVAKWTSDTLNTTGILQAVNSASISMYPNPGTDLVHIIAPEDGQLTMLTLTGEKVYTTAVNKSGSVIDINSLSSGMYIIQFNGQYTSYAPVKWVKQ
jgi:hypothetical protein